VLRRKLLVLDEFGPAGIISTSHARFNHSLGAFDQLALMAVIEAQTGNGGFDLWVSHSADNRLWIYQKSGTTTPSAAGDISLSLPTSPSLAAGSYRNDGVIPLLAFVRIEVKLTSPATGRIKVYAVQRDQGG